MAVFLPTHDRRAVVLPTQGRAAVPRVLARFDGLNQVLQENMAGVRVVKAFVREDYENARFDRENRELQKCGDGRARSAASSSTRRCCS